MTNPWCHLITMLCLNNLVPFNYNALSEHLVPFDYNALSEQLAHCNSLSEHRAMHHCCATTLPVSKPICTGISVRWTVQTSDRRNDGDPEKTVLSLKRLRGPSPVNPCVTHRHCAFFCCRQWRSGFKSFGVQILQGSNPSDQNSNPSGFNRFQTRVQILQGSNPSRQWF